MRAISCLMILASGLFAQSIQPENPFRDGKPYHESEKTIIIRDIDSPDEATVLKALELGAKINYPTPEFLMRIVRNSDRTVNIRAKALDNLESHSQSTKEQRLDLYRELIRDEKEADVLRDKSAKSFPVVAKLLDFIAIKDSLESAVKDKRKFYAMILASSKDGANLLLASARAGKVPASLVRDADVVAKLKATGVGDLDKQLEKLPK